MVWVRRMALVKTGRGAEGAGVWTALRSRRSSTAASRERIRMRAAPRDAPSSIWIRVCSFPAPASISAT